MTTNKTRWLKSGCDIEMKMVMSLAIATLLRVESQDYYILCSRDVVKSAESNGNLTRE